MTQPAPHTRESELREILAEEMAKIDNDDLRQQAEYLLMHNVSTGIVDAALAAMRRISTPLTPSDEMVGAGARAILATLENSDCHELELKNGSIYLEGNFSPDWVAHAVIQAALNLMGGKK